MASEEILHQSINARAYSMGILMAIISMNSTLSFAKKGSVKDLLYSIIAVVILLLCNPFFAPVIVVNYSILLAYSCNNLRLVITHLKWSLVVLIIIGILGLYKSYYLTWNRVDEIYVGWISNFQIIDVILTAASSSIFITTACIIACAILFNRYRVLSGRNVKLGFLFSVVLIVSPYILSISLSKIAGYNLFLPRYLILSNVGFVLIICLIFSILKSTQFKMAVFVLLFAVSHINAKTSLHEEDWRGAVEYIRDEHQKIGKNIPFVYISLGHSESHSDHRLQTRQQVNGWSAPLLIYAKKMEFEVEHDYLPLPLFTERSSYRENLKLELAQKIANNQLEKFYVIVDGRIQITDDKIASLLLINSLKSDFRIISKSFAGDIRVIAFYR
ncbi:MAG TPA: hypothetical protein PJ989_06360 [Oligoflexia bacterium]|nr:hypothetical protein [Oligoflexia bacterium]